MQWPVVILCGGLGTRIYEETQDKPKPMVEIGNKPILWHIMKIYAQYNFKNFILCLGYKGQIIKNYFLTYSALSSDFTINIGKGNVNLRSNCSESDWNVTLVDTGLEAMTGARIKRIEKYVNADNFVVTYGDGIADINIDELTRFHLNHGKIGTITGVYPFSRFGEMVIDSGRVTKFAEKPRMRGLKGTINGGFFVFKRDFFKYVWEEDDCVLEREPLTKLASDGELMVYQHKGFWQCLDTFREKQLLNELWDSGRAKWKIWA
jgi:glucose-1-phosphate cytidylyltransferase